MQELKRAREIIDDVSKETDSILLFHSLSGKDSIVLLDLCYKKFKRVVVVFMYIVKDLEHIMRYYNYAKPSTRTLSLFKFLIMLYFMI